MGNILLEEMITELNDEFVSDLIGVLVKHNVLDEYSSRDFRLKKRYAQLTTADKAGERKISCKQARLILADEFCTSEENVRRIIYRKQ